MRSVTFILVLIYFWTDYHSYYYGLANGFFSPKIPKEYAILFSGSDLGNGGIILKENDIGGSHLVFDNARIYTKKEEVEIKKFKGYYFNKKNIIVEIVEKDNDIKYFLIDSKVEKGEKFCCFFYELSNNMISRDYKYINIEYSLKYFRFIKIFRFIIFFIIVLIFLKYFVVILRRFK